jgi:hypothetical protein
MEMLNLILVDTRGLALTELALGKRVGRNTTCCRQETTIKLNRAAKTFIANTHEAGGQIRHMQWVGRIVRLACGRRRNRSEETITELPEFRIESRIGRQGESQDTMIARRPSEHFARPPS